MTLGEHELVHLRAVVAVWLVNGQRPVDGSTDTRTFVDNDWLGAQTTTDDLIEVELLRHAADGGVVGVAPTMAGIFVAMAGLGVMPVDEFSGEHCPFR